MAANNDAKAVNVGRLRRFLAKCDARFAAKSDAITAADLEEGTSTDAKVASPKVLADYVSGEVDEALGVILNGSY